MFDTFHQKYDSDELEVTTVSGWVIDCFGYIPSVDEQFDFHNLTIKVIDADPKKVTKIYVKVLENFEEEEDETFIDKFFKKDDDKEDDKKEDKKSEKSLHKEEIDDNISNDNVEQSNDNIEDK